MRRSLPAGPGNHFPARKDERYGSTRLGTDRSSLRHVQYRTDANLAARQSIYAYQHAQIDLLAAVLDLAALHRDETVADVGCGNGVYPAELARRGHAGPVLDRDHPARTWSFSLRNVTSPMVESTRVSADLAALGSRPIKIWAVQIWHSACLCVGETGIAGMYFVGIRHCCGIGSS
jgi:hypothetical protein